MNRLKTLIRRNREKNENESANSFLVVMTALPLILGVFGLTVDTTIANSVQDALQSSMNAATQTTLSQAANPINSDRPMLSAEDAYETTKDLYAKNTGRDASGTRGFIPFLICQTQVEGNRGGTLARAEWVSPCAWTEPPGAFQFNSNNQQMELEYTAVEISKTSFMQYFSISYFTYTVSGSSSTSFSGA